MPLSENTSSRTFLIMRLMKKFPLPFKIILLPGSKFYEEFMVFFTRVCEKLQNLESQQTLLCANEMCVCSYTYTQRPSMFRLADPLIKNENQFLINISHQNSPILCIDFSIYLEQL